MFRTAELVYFEFISWGRIMEARRKAQAKPRLGFVGFVGGGGGSAKAEADI